MGQRTVNTPESGMRERENAFYADEFMVQINQSEGAGEPCRELQHAREKYFYILIHFAQTNVNYLPLECNLYKTNHAIWCWMLRHSNQVRNNKEK